MKELVPMLLCNDMTETIDFYTNVLGFKVLNTMGDPPMWCALARENVEVMFSWYPPHDHAPGEEHDHPEPTLTGVLYINTDDVEKLHDEIAPRWSICEPLATQPHGMREFAILDPNGYRLRFGQPL